LIYPKEYEKNLKISDEVLDNLFLEHNVKYEGTDPIPDAKQIFFQT
jgi:hypothetical protein